MGKMIFGKGFVYRFGVSLKEFGERMAHVRAFGVPLLNWCCGPVIALGLMIKNSVISRPMEELR